MSVCVLYANTIESLNKFIDFDYENLSFKLLSFVLPPPPKKKKKCKPFLEIKPEYASLNIIKAMSSSQLILNLSKK